MNKLGHYIRNLRKKGDIKQIPLSKILEISIGTYGAIERGQITPDKGQMLKLYNYYKMEEKTFLMNAFADSEITQKMMNILNKVSSNIAKQL